MVCCQGSIYMKKRSSWKKSEALFALIQARGLIQGAHRLRIYNEHMSSHPSVEMTGYNLLAKKTHSFAFPVEINLYFFLRPTKPSRARPELNRTMGKGIGTGAR
jgi:hypothetical protein